MRGRWRWEQRQLAYVRADGYAVSCAFVAAERDWYLREPLSVNPATAADTQRRMAEEAILEWVSDHIELEHVDAGCACRAVYRVHGGKGSARTSDTDSM